MYRLFFGVFLVLGLVGCSSSVDSSKEEKGDIKEQSIVETAPDFVLEDLEGKKVKLSDYKGKVVLLVFSTTWCPYCRTEIPHLKKMYSQYKERGFEVINIDIQESKKKVSSFAAKHELPYKVLLDADGEVARLYGVKGVPTKVLIGKEGKILCNPCRSVETLLESLLGDKPE